MSDERVGVEYRLFLLNKKSSTLSPEDIAQDDRSIKYVTRDPTSGGNFAEMHAVMLFNLLYVHTALFQPCSLIIICMPYQLLIASFPKNLLVARQRESVSDVIDLDSLHRLLASLLADIKRFNHGFDILLAGQLQHS